MARGRCVHCSFLIRSFAELSETPKEDPKTPAERVFDRHDQICKTALALMVDKNHDYAGASGANPFANFEMSEKLGVCSAEEGIILRMGDKLRRLATFAKDGKLKVASEGSLDAILDIINYGILLQCLIETRQSDL